MSESYFDPRTLPSFIDHTLLKADARAGDIHKLCKEAVEYRFYSVCVNSQWVAYCKQALEGSGVFISAVCGFPLGASLSEVKAFEASRAAEAGATDIDMVLSVGALLDGDLDYVREDIRRVVNHVHGRAIVKVILETSLLNELQKITACQIAEEAGAHFVKTSTGFGSSGATVVDIELMKKMVSGHIGVKASGGIRDLTTAMAMIQAGATRLGTSSGVSIINGLTNEAGY